MVESIWVRDKLDPEYARVTHQSNRALTFQFEWSEDVTYDACDDDWEAGMVYLGSTGIAGKSSFVGGGDDPTAWTWYGGIYGGYSIRTTPSNQPGGCGWCDWPYDWDSFTAIESAAGLDTTPAEYTSWGNRWETVSSGLAWHASSANSHCAVDDAGTVYVAAYVADWATDYPFVQTQPWPVFLSAGQGTVTPVGLAIDPSFANEFRIYQVTEGDNDDIHIDTRTTVAGSFPYEDGGSANEGKRGTTIQMPGTGKLIWYSGYYDNNDEGVWTIEGGSWGAKLTSERISDIGVDRNGTIWWTTLDHQIENENGVSINVGDLATNGVGINCTPGQMWMYTDAHEPLFHVTTQLSPGDYGSVEVYGDGSYVVNCTSGANLRPGAGVTPGGGANYRVDGAMVYLFNGFWDCGDVGTTTTGSGTVATVEVEDHSTFQAWVQTDFVPDVIAGNEFMPETTVRWDKMLPVYHEDGSGLIIDFVTDNSEYFLHVLDDNITSGVGVSSGALDADVVSNHVRTAPAFAVPPGWYQISVYFGSQCVRGTASTRVWYTGTSQGRDSSAFGQITGSLPTAEDFGLA